MADLVTHTFGIAEADAAYRLIERRTEPYLAIRLTYPARHRTPWPRIVACRLKACSRRRARHPGSAGPGPGAFSTGTLLPAFRAAGSTISSRSASASGLSARRAAERHGFEKAVSGPDALLDDPDVEVVVIATPHDTHADLAVRALTAGRHVWCEKPLALTLDELDAVEKAWRESGCQLAVGFNRRWSPAVLAARQALAGTCRGEAGGVPGRRRAGARRPLVPRPAAGRAAARRGVPLRGHRAGPGRRADRGCGRPAGRRRPGGRHGDDAVVSLRFADGSLAAIAYGSADPVAGKEWIEIQAGQCRVVIDDFRRAEVDGKTAWKGRQDKGHQAAVAAFRQAVAGSGPAMPTEVMLATMRATIRAAGGGGMAGFRTVTPDSHGLEDACRP